MAWRAALVTVSVGMLLAATAPAAAELVLPPGFATEVYVTGQGFDTGSDRGARGIPATSTLAVDEAGLLYLARTGARFTGGEVMDLTPLFRIPAGGATLTPDTEARFLHGPPLRNPQVGAIGPGGELFVTTFDRDRRIGALYRVTDGRPVLFAGGTPLDGSPPLLRQPEGVAVDRAGHVLVADREQGLVVRLDPAGKVLQPRYVTVTRPRMLLLDDGGHLWIGTDGTAETPFQSGSGEIWRVSPEGEPALVLRGPLPAGMSLSPGGSVFVAQRRTGQVFVVAPDGRRIDFVGSTDGTALRGLRFVPVAPATRRAGIAGDLLLVAVTRQMWALNQVLRVSGPFDDFVRQRLAAP